MDDRPGCHRPGDHPDRGSDPVELAGPALLDIVRDTPENNAIVLGLAILVFRGAWIGLKPLNDAAERWLKLPNSPIAPRKPQPLDDF